MIRLTNKLLAALFTLLTISTGYANTVTIGTWNIEFLDQDSSRWISARSDKDYQALANTFSKTNIDILAVQEVANAASLQRVVGDGYTFEMSDRVSKTANQAKAEKWRQHTGFAIRSDLKYTRYPDLDFESTGLRNMRNAVDIGIVQTDGTELRLLAVHLKSGCFSNQSNAQRACDTLSLQVPLLDAWIKQREAAGDAYILLGDFNRRLKRSGDAIFGQLQAASPAQLLFPSNQTTSKCLTRGNKLYSEYIDHILVSEAAATRKVPQSFKQTTFALADIPLRKLSDHCPIHIEYQR
ncbi:endonuclease/exonuclease/phosphatase family protein [Aliagarivorans taiwanensis]|uniref:endonuclease/exonuclease/phosphatase family protein n=1 Tax=Aliagarivorans taiwanensis TaxID=561966 RepID=UPI0004149F36|nr:endonuclease/exonuclease/phosphatase family protein [Aliagarivorans taiwanensis]